MIRPYTDSSILKIVRQKLISLLHTLLLLDTVARPMLYCVLEVSASRREMVITFRL